MTDPTAHAAKLLPCPWCGAPAQLRATSDGYEVTCFGCTGNQWSADREETIRRWNTRPQPAPPAGEPLAIVSELSHFWPTPWRYDDEHPSWGGPTIVDKNDGTIARLFWPGHPPEETERAEKATAMLANAIVGLAARPKVEEALIKELNGVIKFHNERAEAAEAKLAEREAELAAVDTIIDNQWGTMTEIDKYKFQKITNAAITRHAARQQQKENGE